MSFRLTEAELTAIIARQKGRKAPGRPTAASKPKADPFRYPVMLAIQIRDAALPAPILEYAFDQQLGGTGRGWKIDLAYPFRSPPLAIEVDGMVHRIKARHKGDMTKHQALHRQGWSLLRVSPQQVKDGEALKLVTESLQLLHRTKGG